MSELFEALVAIALLYGHQAAESVREVAETDPAWAMDVAMAALDPTVLWEKHHIDKGQRKADWEAMS